MNPSRFKNDNIHTQKLPNKTLTVFGVALRLEVGLIHPLPSSNTLALIGSNAGLLNINDAKVKYTLTHPRLFSICPLQYSQSIRLPIYLAG